MTKDEVLEKLEQYKGRPIEILCDNTVQMYMGIEGHWVLTDDKGIYEVRKNSTSTTPGIAGMTQNESPFIITYTEYEHIQYIRGYLAPDVKKIKELLSSLTPMEPNVTINDIIDQICSDRIIVANSARGFSNAQSVASDDYGQFTGSFVSTSQDIPHFMESIVNRENEKTQGTKE